MPKTILVVTDNRQTLESVTRVLIGSEFQVCSAADRIDGQYQLGLIQPDLVILDLEGREALQRFRALSPVPIITLVEGDPLARIESLDLGADCALAKPPSPQELGARVRALLRRSASPRQWPQVASRGTPQT